MNFSFLENSPPDPAKAEAEADRRAEYEERRRCTATRADGAPCRGWSVWKSPVQLCATHLHPKRRKQSEMTDEIRAEHQRRNAPVCHCAAYDWPHREGNGLCCGADGEPLANWPTPTGQREHGKLRRRDKQRRLKRLGLKGLEVIDFLVKRGAAEGLNLQQIKTGR